MTTRNELTAHVLSMVRSGWSVQDALVAALSESKVYRAYYDKLTTYAQSVLLQHIERVCSNEGATSK